MEICIYQVNMERDESRVAFAGFDRYSEVTGKNYVESAIYDKVFDGEVNCKNLEDVYRMFNFSHPGDYTGRSMSVSDVIEVTNSETVVPGFYYCDNVGFKKCDFKSENAEMLGNGKMTVVLVEPGRVARNAEIGATLEDMQNAVEGCAKAIYPYGGEAVAIICDEEGKIAGKELNRAIYDENGQMIDVIAGTFFICGCNGQDFGSLNKEQIEKYGTKFYYPEKFVKFDDEIKALKYKPDAAAKQSAPTATEQDKKTSFKL